MKLFFFIFMLLIAGINLKAQVLREEQERDLAFYNATNNWFSAWKLVSKNIYKVKKAKPVDFVFFDDKYVYTTSDISTSSEATMVKGGNLLNLKFTWIKALHNNILTLPDSAVVDVGLMSFVATISDKSDKAYFTMPLPSFWKQSGVTSKELGLANLITGVFIHEFSHAQQMQNFGKKMTEYEQQTNFEQAFTDDIVQHLFAKDSSYVESYHKEVALLYSSLNNNGLDKQKLSTGLALLKQQHKEFFKGEFASLHQIDNFFLTMEGLGQYSMYLWLTNARGANLNKELAIEGVRRGGKWWSQDEGFALFLILDKLAKPKKWAKDMFGTKTEDVTELIDNLLH